MAEKKKAAPAMMLTGCDLLDLLVGGDKGVYGLPFGTIVNIIGDKSAGKSFLKNEIIAANHWALGDSMRWESDDCESGDTFDTTRLYGFDIHPAGRRIGSKKDIEDSATIEEMDAKVSLFLESMDEGQVGIYAVDSLDGLSDATREAMEAGRLGQLKNGKDVKDPGDYGAQIAKFLSQQFFRTKHKKLEDAGVSLILVSQIRDKMNAATYGPKWEVSCGKALEFYCHTRIFLKTVLQIKKGDRVVGAYVEATTIKSKTPRPYRKVYYSVYFDYGLDNIGSNIDYLFDLRTDKGEIIKDAASAIVWESGKKQKDLAGLTAWLDETGLKEACRTAKKEKTGNSTLSVAWILEWEGSSPEIHEKFLEAFGKEFSRDELITMCEKNPEMREELTRRVREKWEAAEDAVATNRPSKYARG